MFSIFRGTRLVEVFTLVYFIYGPKYSRSRREAHVLINFSGKTGYMVVTEKCVVSCQMMWCLFERDY